MKPFLLRIVVAGCLLSTVQFHLVAQANSSERARRSARSSFRSQAERWLQIEQAILDQVNAVRAARGVSPLLPDSQLSEVARRHSRDMIERNYFDHQNPERQRARQRVMQSMGDVRGGVSENIWMRLGALPYETPEQTANAIVDAWMGSPSHRENLLRPDSTHLGVGFYGSRDGLHLRATQVFASLLKVSERTAGSRP